MRQLFSPSLLYKYYNVPILTWACFLRVSFLRGMDHRLSCVRGRAEKGDAPQEQPQRSSRPKESCTLASEATTGQAEASAAHGALSESGRGDGRQPRAGSNLGACRFPQASSTVIVKALERAAGSNPAQNRSTIETCRSVIGDYYSTSSAPHSAHEP